MNTNTLEQFTMMDEIVLSSVEGGYSGRQCLRAFGKNVVAGAVGGSVAGAPALGVGAIAGGFVGAHVGAIAGGLYCTARFIGG